MVVAEVTRQLKGCPKVVEIEMKKKGRRMEEESNDDNYKTRHDFSRFLFSPVTVLFFFWNFIYYSSYIHYPLFIAL